MNKVFAAFLLFCLSLPAVAQTQQGTTVVQNAVIGNGWHFASLAVTSATTVSIQAANATGLGTLRTYCSSFQYQNTGTTATEIDILDGSTVIWRGYATASMTNATVVAIAIPLRGSPDTAFSFKVVTASANIYFNAQGYTAQ